MSDDDTFDEFEKYAAEIAKAAAEWEKRWPQACKSCYGRGGQTYTEMHGFKHGAGEQMFDICECIEEAKCPRCGFCNWDEDNEEETPCIKCGWNWGKGEDDVCPEV